MKNKLLIILILLASISHMHAMEKNCMDSNPEIKKAYDSLIDVQKTRNFIRYDEFSDWNILRNEDPHLILHMLKHEIKISNKALHRLGSVDFL